MLLATDLFLAMRCPECGKQMLYRSMSLFKLHRTKIWQMECSCGAKPCLVEFHSNRSLLINIYGPCCEEAHEFIYEVNELQNGEVYDLNCDIDDLHLGYIGSKESVLAVLTAEGMLLTEYEDELKGHFQAPAVMGKMLAALNTLYGNGNICCQKCGRVDLNIDIEHNSIVIGCAECGNHGVLSAAAQNDSHLLTEAKTLIITQEGLKITTANAVRGSKNQPVY
ncbi:MAG: hypothetical protein PHN47_00995 [Clostridia bacterium]|jgi:predicted RNA-binding Zn-ribbon protein involved in translation (DUF1610 family)|nr:hypothetical protein [Clostridia bacterium]MDD4571056.1 hypothetical protein [Clostridia bacterium]